jgi:hypothetical protein
VGTGPTEVYSAEGPIVRGLPISLETLRYAKDVCMAYMRTALTQLLGSISPSTSTVTNPPHVGCLTITSKPCTIFPLTSLATHSLLKLTVSSALNVCANNCRLPR